MRGCSELHSWTIPRIGHMDRPSWTFPCGWATHGALKTGRCSKSDQTILVSFLTQCYYPHTLKLLVSPVHGIYLGGDFERWCQRPIKLILVLLSAVEKDGVSRMGDFFLVVVALKASSFLADLVLGCYVLPWFNWALKLFSVSCSCQLWKKHHHILPGPLVLVP